MDIKVQDKQPKQLLSKASGFLQGYTHTLNPYIGCTFACSYCYVRQMPVALFRGSAWGSYVEVKKGAAALLEKELRKALNKGQVTIFMSSSTDPYQPQEAKAGNTRSLLTVMTELQPDFLFVQTRSPLVSRDFDLLEKLGQKVRLSMTIETDRDDMRRLFSPYAPPLQGRLKALKEAFHRGIPAQAAIAPVLPSTDGFAALLAGVVDRVCIDDFFMGDGSNGRRTERIGVKPLYERHGLSGWYERGAYVRVLEQLRKHFPEERIGISQAGFMPDAAVHESPAGPA